MPSPFPGMDPYLERPAIWPEVHLTLIVAMCAELNAAMPDRFIAGADRYVWIHEPDASSRMTGVRPDVFVTDSFPELPAGKQAAAVTAPGKGLVPAICREGDRYLKIVDSDSNVVVTVVELLSPTNKKRGPDREDYLTKRLEYLSTGVNFVELDLLRGGERTPVDQPTVSFVDYGVTVCRAHEFPQLDLWPFSLRDPMPKLPIPLMPGVEEPLLDLRRCLDRAYKEGKYRRKGRYHEAPTPPIREQDREWVDQILANLEPDPMLDS